MHDARLGGLDVACGMVSASCTWRVGAGGGRSFLRRPRSLRCESKDGDDNICPADVRGGVRLLRTLSRSDCDEKHDLGRQRRRACGSGTDAGRTSCSATAVRSAAARARRVMRCESRSNRWQHCPAETRAGVELVRQLVEESVHARPELGCRLARRLGVRRLPRRVPDDGRRRRRSRRGRDRPLRFGRETPPPLPGWTPRAGVRMVRQLSRAACIEGRSWGVDDNGIWVQDGCRANSRSRKAEQTGG